LPRRFVRAYAGSNENNAQAGEARVIASRRSLILAFIAALLAVVPAAAKNTGLIFVSNEKSNNVLVLDPKTYKVVKDIKTAERQRDTHFNADRTRLYVACGDDDVIEVIDVANEETATVAVIPVGRVPWGVVIDD
jgi:YVTN family beta-propeller protein